MTKIIIGNIYEKVCDEPCKQMVAQNNNRNIFLLLLLLTMNR